MKLVIVESPTKAKTISKFLGKKYVVKSSFGHVRDLPKNDMGVDIENNFTPKYVIPTKAKPKVAILKDLVDEAEEIILATDEDREGEAIAWHLVSALKLDKLKKEHKRIAFHEITQKAIEAALEKPRSIDNNLVDAQQGRRILDRLVGYELSPFLWKKIRRGLSAGRVQSVALRFVVEREREIEKFSAQEFWIVGVTLAKDKEGNFDATLTEKNGEKIEKTIVHKLFAGDYRTKQTTIIDEGSAKSISEDLAKSKYSVKSVERKEMLRQPAPPFTTSTLQQSAINNLSMSAKQAMMTAQKLYEEGYITYMRTDSVNLSMESMLAARKIITQKFGKQYALENPRLYKTKSKGAQEAHEAIRPTNPGTTPEDLQEKLDPNGLRLYRLIWSRMVACQMQPAIFDSMRVGIKAKGDHEYLLHTSGSTLKFDGYLAAHGERESTDVILPNVTEGESLDFIKVQDEKKLSSPPPRYTEAALVKILEEKGIGRPSTYAPTIATIMERNYIEKNEEKKLIPLEIGFLVNDILVEHFPEIVDMQFTAKMEDELDQVAEGKTDWVSIIRNFYGPFSQHLEKKKETVKKENILEKLERSCPKCGGDLIMKFGRFGKFIACNNFPTCKYTEKTTEEKKLDEENSGMICKLCGAPMVVKRGRFGAFLGCSKYPECKGIERIEKGTGIKCPKCNKGEIIERKSKRGKMFYGCNSYPDCNFALWNKPTG